MSLARLFRVRAGEGGLVLALGMLLLGNSLALNAADVVAVSGFLAQVGVQHILIVYMVDMLLMAVAVGFYSLIIDRYNRVVLMRWLILGLASMSVALRLTFELPVPTWLTYALLYLLADQQLLIVPLLFWALANDIFSSAQAKRLFPLISAAGFVGQILGFGIAAAWPRLAGQLHVASIDLLNLNALVYLLLVPLVLGRLKGADAKPRVRKRETVRDAVTEGWVFVREVPSFRFLMLAILGVGFCMPIVDYHFLSVSKAVLPDSAAFQSFYGLFRMGVVIVAAVIQALLTSRIVAGIGFKNAFLILPHVLMLGVAWMILVPGLVSAVGARALSRLALSTVDEFGRKAFQALVPDERRGRVSAFMDVHLYAAAIFAGSGSTLLIVLLAPRLQIGGLAYAYLALAALASGFAIWAVLRMRAVFDSSMLSWRLKRRQRGRTVLDKLEL